MFPSHSAQQVAIASQLLAELEGYEQSLQRMLQREFDAEDYRAQCDAFDRMQMYASALPRLRASWSEVLISRVELAHAMWFPGLPTRVNGKVVALHACQLGLIAEVRRQCGRYLGA